MLYMIHACEDREWYVNDYLIPSMKAQGIPDDEIQVWMDTEHKGNLYSCMESFEECGKSHGATWHLQDDVIIADDFYDQSKKFSKRQIVCGFCGKEVGPSPGNAGHVKPYQMWWSFQCIQIPNDLAGGCAEWFYKEALTLDREDIQSRIKGGKSDDWFFKRYLVLHRPYEDVINLYPNLVDHIDYLLGGSIVNKSRKKDHTAAYFLNKDLVKELERKIRNDVPSE